MKNRFTVMLLATLMFITCILSGCNTQSTEFSAAPPEPSTEKTTLSVYMVDTDALFVDAVHSFRKQAQDITLDVTSFTTCQAMLDAAEEASLTDSGPDVLLYNSNSMQGEVDGYTLAKSGMFLPLDQFIRKHLWMRDTSQAHNISSPSATIFCMPIPVSA